MDTTFDVTIQYFYGYFANFIRRKLIDDNYVNGLYRDSNEILSISNKAIFWLSECFIVNTRQMLTTFEDVRYFLSLYSITSNPSKRKAISFRHTCRYILSILPSLDLISSSDKPNKKQQIEELAKLIALSDLIQHINQARAIELISKNKSVQITLDDRFVYIDYINPVIKSINNMLCGSDNGLSIHKSFIPDYTYYALVDIIYKDCGNIAHTLIDYQYKMESQNDWSSVFEVTDEVIGNEGNAFLQGFLFDRINVDFLKSIINPLDPFFRTKSRPIVCLYIDGVKRAFSTAWLIYEALDEISSNMITYNILPSKWELFPHIVKLKHRATNDLGKMFEKEVLMILLSQYTVKHNIISINNISLNKANVPDTNRKVGEIDYIAIDTNMKKIFVIDAKCTKTKFFFQSFPDDQKKFEKYTVKLKDKAQWVESHLKDIAMEFNLDSANDYIVKSLFVTNSLVFYGFFSELPIIPIDKLLLFLKKGDRRCLINSVSD